MRGFIGHPVTALLNESNPQQDLLREIHAAGWPPLVPLLQLTSRPGTPQQKTWLLRRAVTIIGSRPTAHIMLRNDEVSKTHAAIICNGTEPIICDLVSRNGTFVRGERIRTSRLREGNELHVGPYDVRVHTQPLPGSRGRNFESGQFAAILPGPVLQLVDEDGHTVLSVSDGAAVVGTREGADLVVKSDASLPAVAILMAWRRGWAVYDLAHDEEPRTQVNGNSVFSAAVRPGDRITFSGNTYKVVFEGEGPPEMDAATLVSGAIGTSDSSTAEPAPEPARPDQEVDTMNDPAQGQTPGMLDPNGGPDVVLGMLEKKLASLQSDLASSYQQLHEYQTQVDRRAAEISEQEGQFKSQAESVARQAAELTARSASLDERGKSLDAQTAEIAKSREEIERLQSELAERQRQIEEQGLNAEAQQARIAEEDSKLQARQAEVEKQAQQAESQRQEIEKQAAELNERQQAFDKQQQEVQSAQDALAAERQTIEEARAKLRADADAIEDQRKQMEAESEQLRLRIENVTQLEQTVDERLSEFEARERQIETREEQCAQQKQCMREFQAALQRAVAVFNVTPDAVMEDAPRSYREPAPTGPTDETDTAAEAEASATEAVQGDPEPPQADDPQQSPAPADSTAHEEAAAAVAKARPAQEEQAPDEKPTPAAGSLDLDSLDPATRERFRMLRRLAPPTRTDAELLAQLRNTPSREGNKEPQDPANKRRWPWRK